LIDEKVDAETIAPREMAVERREVANKSLRRSTQGSAIGVGAVILAQWPLAAIARNASPSRGFAMVDVVTAAILLCALICFWRAPKQSARTGVACLIVAGCLLMSLSQFVAFRDSWLFVAFVLCGVTWFYGGLCSFSVGLRHLCLLAISIAGLLGAAALGEAALMLNLGAGSHHAAPKLVGRIKQQDDKLTFRPLANAEARSISPDFDVVYHIDVDAGRVVPNRPTTGPEWLCFGCSYTFGEGLDDADTLPAKLQELNPDHRVFNYALGGYGTTDSLLQMSERLPARADVSACIYFLLADHLRRNVCPPELLATSWGSKPRFMVDGEGTPRFRGKADRAMPVSERLAVSLLRRSNLVSLLYPEWQPNRASIDLTVALVAEMRAECERHGNGQIVTVLLPQPTPRWSGALKALDRELQSGGSEMLNLEEKFADHLVRNGEDRAAYFYPHDRHPNSRYTALIASWVSEYMQGSEGQP
jgi:hypothetical protein